MRLEKKQEEDRVINVMLKRRGVKMKQKIMGRVALLFLSLLFIGCFESRPGITPEQRAKVKPYILLEEPKPQYQLGANLEEKVILLGYDITTLEAKPGDDVTVTWYWYCKREVGDGWRLFTHGMNEAGEPRINLDNIGLIRELFPPYLWKKGTYIKDIQKIHIPSDWNSEVLELRTGIWKGDYRLTVIGGPRDNENRVRGPQIHIKGVEEKGIPPISKMALPYLEGEIQIDGKLVEEQWQKGFTTEKFVNPLNGIYGDPSTVVKGWWDGSNLYLGFELHDDHIFSTYKNRDDELWHQDVVEIFIDPEGDERDYFEIQISPANVIFDTKIPSAPMRDKREDSFNIEGFKSAVAIDGTLNNDTDEDGGWSVEIVLPLANFGKVPKPGERWRMNFFRLDTGKKIARSFLSWSAPLQNTTHVPSRFGEVLFLNKGEPIPPLRQINISVISTPVNKTVVAPPFPSPILPVKKLLPSLPPLSKEKGK